MAHNLASLSVSPSAQEPIGQPEVGDLVTVALFNGKRAGARLTRIAFGRSYYVTLNGLVAPEPYRLGDRLVLDRSQVVDWSR